MGVGAVDCIMRAPTRFLWLCASRGVCDTPTVRKEAGSGFRTVIEMVDSWPLRDPDQGRLCTQSLLRRGSTALGRRHLSGGRCLTLNDRRRACATSPHSTWPPNRADRLNIVAGLPSQGLTHQVAENEELDLLGTAIGHSHRLITRNVWLENEHRRASQGSVGTQPKPPQRSRLPRARTEYARH